MSERGTEIVSADDELTMLPCLTWTLSPPAFPPLLQAQNLKFPFSSGVRGAAVKAETPVGRGCAKAPNVAKVAWVCVEKHPMCGIATYCSLLLCVSQMLRLPLRKIACVAPGTHFPRH